MSNIQYTIRSVPKKLDDFLRKQAALSDQSLNTTVLKYLEESTKLDLQADEDDFLWLIGANTIDDNSLAAIADLKQRSKEKTL